MDIFIQRALLKKGGNLKQKTYTKDPFIQKAIERKLHPEPIEQAPNQKTEYPSFDLGLRLDTTAYQTTPAVLGLEEYKKPTELKFTEPTLIAARPETKTEKGLVNKIFNKIKDIFKPSDEEIRDRARAEWFMTKELQKELVNEHNKEIEKKLKDEQGRKELVKDIQEILNSQITIPNAKISEKEIEKNLDDLARKILITDEQSAQISPDIAEYVHKNYDELSKAMGYRGETATEKTMRFMETASLPLIAFGLLEAPVATILGLAGWQSLVEAENYVASKLAGEKYKPLSNKELADLANDKVNRATKDALEILEFLGKAAGTGIISFGLSRTPFILDNLKNNWTKEVITKYNLPKKFTVKPEELDKLGEIIKKYGIEDELKISKKDIQEAKKRGLTVEIPTVEITEIVDKPYWGKIKEILTLKPTKEVYKIPKGEIKYEVIKEKQKTKPKKLVEIKTKEKPETEIKPVKEMSLDELQKTLDEINNKINKKIEKTRNELKLKASKEGAGNIKFKINGEEVTGFSMSKIKKEMARRKKEMIKETENILFKTDKEYKELIKNREKIEKELFKKQEDMLDLAFSKALGGDSFAAKGDFVSEKQLNKLTKKLDKVRMSEIQLKRLAGPELIKLYKAASGGETPFVKNFPTSLGRFYADPEKPRIGINPKIAEEPGKLEKVLSHEIGHFIDFVPDKTMARGNILGRLQSLKGFRRHLLGDEKVIEKRKKVMKDIRILEEKAKKATGKKQEEYNKKLNEKYIELDDINEKLVFKKDIQEELIKLSEIWRPYNKEKANPRYISYRESAPELYADFISVLLNAPELAYEKAPKTFDLFFKYLDEKPAIKEKYFSLMEDLQGNSYYILDKRDVELTEKFITAKEKELQMMAARIVEPLKLRASKVFRALTRDFVEKDIDLIKKTEQMIKDGKDIPPEKNPSYLLEELDLIKNVVYDLFEKIKPIEDSFKNLKLDDVEFSKLLFLLRVKDDRKTKINPMGYTREIAIEQLGYLKTKWGEEKYNKMIDLANQFNKEYKKVLKKFYEAGMLDKEKFENLYNNQDIYATFKTIDHIFEEFTTPNMYKVIGTFKDIGQTYQATIAKMVAMTTAAERNVFRKSAGEIFLKNLNPKEFKIAEKIDQRTGFAREYTYTDDGIKLELFKWKEDGKWKGMYIDPFIAKSLKYNSKLENNIALDVIKLLNNEIFRKAYIDYSIRFMVRNPIRDLQQAWKALSFLDLQGTGPFSVGPIEFTKYINKARKEAWIYAKGGKTTTIKEMLEKRILGVDEDYHMTKAEFDEATALEREMIKRGLKFKDGKINKNKIYELGSHIGNFAIQIGKTTEALTKITAYMILRDELAKRGLKINKELVSHIRNNVGTPNWRRGGKLTPATNVIWMFSNVWIQGWKRTFKILGNPNTRGGYIFRAAYTAFIPKMFMWLGANGWLGEDLRKMYDRIPDYAKKNYIVLPIKTHNYKTIALTIPLDYDVKFATHLLWVVWDTLRDKILDKEDFFGLIAQEMPSVTQLIHIINNWWTFLQGENPKDSYYRYEIIDKNTFEANGWQSYIPMLKWTWNTIFGGILFKFNLRGKYRNEDAIEKTIRLTPVVNAFIHSYNYGIIEKQKKEEYSTVRLRKLEDAKDNKIIYKNVEKFFKETHADLSKILYYENKTLNELNKIRERTDKEKVYLKKKFMRELLKGYNNAYITSLLYTQYKEDQIKRIKDMKKNLDENDYLLFKTLLLGSKIISEETWNQAELELIIEEKTKKEK